MFPFFLLFWRTSYLVTIENESLKNQMKSKIKSEFPVNELVFSALTTSLSYNCTIIGSDADTKWTYYRSFSVSFEILFEILFDYSANYSKWTYYRSFSVSFDILFEILFDYSTNYSSQHSLDTCSYTIMSIVQ